MIYLSDLLQRLNGDVDTVELLKSRGEGDMEMECQTTTVGPTWSWTH